MTVPVPSEPLVNEANLTTNRWYEFFADNEAWTPFTPTVSAGSGTFTSVAATGHHKRAGRMVHFSVRIVITTNGTAATHVAVTLPFVSRAGAHSAYGIALSAATALVGSIAASGSSLVIYSYDGTYPGADGRTLVVNGFYETAT